MSNCHIFRYLSSCSVGILAHDQLQAIDNHLSPHSFVGSTKGIHFNKCPRYSFPSTTATSSSFKPYSSYTICSDYTYECHQKAGGMRKALNHLFKLGLYTYIESRFKE